MKEYGNENLGAFYLSRPARGATIWAALPRGLAHDISTHAPLAGRDCFIACKSSASAYFNPRAPCGARPLRKISIIRYLRFQPTRPLRGATRITSRSTLSRYFNPRAPCGARQQNAKAMAFNQNISTHAPLAGRDWSAYWYCWLDCSISTHAPLAGRDVDL